MEHYLNAVKDLAIRFAQLGQPYPDSEVNDRILAGLGEEWEPLILALAPNLKNMSIDALSSLLLNQAAKKDHWRLAAPVLPLSCLLRPAPTTNLTAGSRRGSYGGRGRSSGRGGHHSPLLFSSLNFSLQGSDSDRGRRGGRSLTDRICIVYVESIVLFHCAI